MGHKPPLRALNFGDVLDQTIALIRDNFRAWLKISSIAYLPIVVLQMVQLAMVGPSMFDFSSLAQGQPPPDFGPTVIFWFVSTVILGIVSGFGFLLLSAALTHGIAQRFLGQPVSASGSYRAALGSLWRLILCSIVAVLLFLLIMAISAVPVGAAAFLRLPEWAIVAVGIISFLATVVLSICFSIRWTLALPAIVLERAGAVRGLRRSSELVKGLWWRTLGLLLLATIGMYMLISLPSSVISMMAVFAAMALRPDLTYLALILSTAVGGLFTILAAPIIPSVLTLIYYDARMRKEGFDLLVLAERLGQDLPPAADPQA